MNITFPKVTAAIKLADYAPGFEGEIVTWCNPPRKLINDTVAAAKQDGEPFYACLAQLWQNWTVEDIGQVREQSEDTDPAFFPWLVTQTFERITEHRNRVKKA